MSCFRGRGSVVAVLPLCGLPQQLPPREPFLCSRHSPQAHGDSRSPRQPGRWVLHTLTLPVGKLGLRGLSGVPTALIKW